MALNRENRKGREKSERETLIATVFEVHRQCSFGRWHVCAVSQVSQCGTVILTVREQLGSHG